MESASSFVNVYVLPTGKIHLPDRWIFEDGDNDLIHSRQLYPDFSFLICHPSGKRVLFDLGLRKVSDHSLHSEFTSHHSPGLGK
jgi:hypothetical protein